MEQYCIEGGIMAQTLVAKTKLDFQTTLNEFNAYMKNNPQVAKNFEKMDLEGKVAVEGIYSQLRTKFGQTKEAAAYWARAAINVVKNEGLNENEAIALVKIAWELNELSGKSKTVANTEFLRRNPPGLKQYVKNEDEAYAYLANKKNSYEDGELAYIFDSLKTALSRTENGEYLFQSIGQDSPHRYLGFLSIDILQGLGENGLLLFESKL